MISISFSVGDTNIPPYWVVIFSLLFFLLHMEYPAFYAAFAEYADRMYDESDDLVTVDVFTVPMDVDMTRLAEWADVE